MTVGEVQNGAFPKWVRGHDLHCTQALSWPCGVGSFDFISQVADRCQEVRDSPGCTELRDEKPGRSQGSPVWTGL